LLNTQQWILAVYIFCSSLCVANNSKDIAKYQLEYNAIKTNQYDACMHAIIKKKGLTANQYAIDSSSVKYFD
jgi:hypothetical protein